MRAHRRRREQTKAGVGAAWEMWHAALLMVVAPSPCEPATRVHVRGKQSAPSGACLSCVLACERERNAIVRPPTNKLVGRRKRDPRNLLQTRSPFTQSSPERDVQNKTRQDKPWETRAEFPLNQLPKQQTRHPREPDTRVVYLCSSVLAEKLSSS